MPAAPSLLIVPYRSKTGRLYSQIPVPVAPATTGAGDFTVTRDTTATRFNSAGLIASVASGIPRLDYYTSGGTAGCPALLVEPAATNGILNSTDTTTSWTLGANLTSGAIDVIGVSGNNLTVAVSGSGIGSAAGCHQRTSNNITLTSGSTYTISFLMKKTGTHTIGGFFANTSGATNTVFGSGFDVSGSFSSGSLIQSSPITNRIRRVEQWGTDVYRCSETFTMTATNVLTTFRLGPTVSVTNLDNPAVGTQLGFAAPQLELGSVPTSFIPTTTAAVPRNADVISVSGAVSGSIGQTEGTMYFEVSDVKGVITGTGNPALMIRNSAFTNWIGLTSNAVAAPFRITVRSTITTLINYTSAISEGKVAIAYNASGAVVYVNGIEVATTATNPNFTFNIVSMEQYMPFKVKSLALYTTRLTNDELRALTA